MITTAVVPVKQLENAKQRLAASLTPPERGAFMQAMVEDVLAVLRTSARIDRLLVVTRDPAVSAVARTFDAEIMAEHHDAGLTPAVTAVAQYLRRAGVDVMLFVPGDIPLITTAEIEVVTNGVTPGEAPRFVIVPATDLGGSNCVVCSPPDCMEFGFGDDSFRRHLRIARSRGIEPVVAKLPGMGLDVDTPADLKKLVEELKGRKTETNTHRFLRDSGIMNRLSEGAVEYGIGYE